MSAQVTRPWTRMAGHILVVWAVAAWPVSYLWATVLLRPYTTGALPPHPPRLLGQLCLLPAELLIAAGLALALLSRGRWWTILESILALLSGLALYVPLDFLVLMASF
jgi:hypothetical protein